MAYGASDDLGVLAIIIIFQPELRRALEQLGRGKFFSRSIVQEQEEQDRLVEQIVKATSYMAKRRIGALISIEKDTGLTDYIETGILLGSHISSELLINVFIPNTPLHDGAVILRKINWQLLPVICHFQRVHSYQKNLELGIERQLGLVR